MMQKAFVRVGTAVTAAAGVYAYAAMSPTSQMFGRTIVAGRDIREIALTFDDGPNDPETLRLLETLERHSVRATFFCIGRFVRQRPDIVRAVARAGHLVGNHTHTHPRLLLRAPVTVARELADANAALEDALGQRVEYFRPPHGARRPDVLQAARELGLRPVMWNVTGHDWKATTVEQIVHDVRKGVRRNIASGNGSNVLLHDGGQQCIGIDRALTLDATARLLEVWRRGQFSFVTPARWG